MAFTPPNFNLLANGWYHPHTPGAEDPDVFEIPAQYYVEPRQGGADIDYDSDTPEVPVLIVRLPAAFEVDDLGIWIWQLDTPYTPYYRVYFKTVMHPGFPNKYLAHFCRQCDSLGAYIYAGVEG